MRRFSSLTLAVGMLMLSSCSPSQQVTAEPEVADVNVILFWLPTVEFSGLWVAEEMGWYEEEGINLTYQPWGEGVDPIKQVAAADQDDDIVLGFQDGASLIIARSTGIPVKAIWAGTQRSPFGFLVRPDSGVETVADFEGRPIGYRPHELYVLEAVLAHEGLSLNDITPISLSRDPAPLLAGDVDAFLAFVTNTPIALQLQGINVDIIYASEYGYEFYSDVLFATDNTIAEHGDLLRRFVEVTNRGWQYALEHPEEVAQMVVEKYYQDGTVDHQTLQLEAFRPLASERDDFSDLGTMTVDKWQLGVDLLLNYGQLEEAINAESVFTDEFSNK